jgi:hypothetical protein
MLAFLLIWVRYQQERRQRELDAMRRLAHSI